MNRQRGIEQVLDVWLSDGPTVMPDRLFEAVLDRVERVPQRRLARLQMRFSEMTPQIRLYTLGAVGLAAALVATYLFARSIPDTNVGGSPSPVATATSSPQASVPDAVRATWMGPPKDIPGIVAGAGVTLELTGLGALWMTQSQQTDEHHLISRVVITDAHTIDLTSVGAGECPSGAKGTYGWTLSSSGKALTLTATADACAERLAALPGTYHRMACPTDQDNCLGPIDAGTYSSQFFDPFVPHGGAWNPRYGALAYTVPAGWTNIDDWPEYFGLGPDGAAGNPQIYLASDMLPKPDDDPCADRPSSTVGRSASEIAGWIDGLAGVKVTAPRTKVTVAGLPAWRMDVRIASSWTLQCPWNTGSDPDRPLFTDATANNDGFDWGIPPHSSMRLWLVDLGDGRALMIDFESETQASFEKYVDDASTIVESFVLNR